MSWIDVAREMKFRPLDNLGLKAVALLLAFLLWSQVSAGLAVLHIVPNVPLTLENLPPELAISEPYTENLSVRLRGTGTRLRNLTPGELSPAIDLFGAHAGDNIVILTPDDIPVPLGIEVERIDPGEILVVLEDREKATLPLMAVVEGDPAPGYAVGPKTVVPPQVTVTGPRSRVRRLQSVPTESVSVSGRRQTLEREVAIRTNDSLVEIEGGRTVSLTIEINEVAVTEQLDGIRVEVVGSSYAIAVNPPVIGVVISLPGSVLATLSADNIRAIIDGSSLRPRREDYLVEPVISFEPAELADQIRVIALTPQRRLNVHVFDRVAPETN